MVKGMGQFSIFLCLSISCLCFNLFHIGNASVEANNGPVFSLVLKGASLNSCLERISILSGYEIFVTGEYVDYKINIDLKNVTIEKSLQRLLKGINHAIEWDAQHLKINLFLYGSQKTDYITKKFTGVSPLVSLQTNIKKDSAELNQSTSQMSNGYQSESSVEGNKENFSGSGVNLKVSGANTSFVQGTPTGSFDP